MCTLLRIRNSRMVDHLFNDYSFIKHIWHWIATYDNFTFNCQTIKDLLCIEYRILFKNDNIDIIGERSSKFDSLVRKKQTFNRGNFKSSRSIGLAIISLVH
jgi:hypothetical protein